MGIRGAAQLPCRLHSEAKDYTVIGEADRLRNLVDHVSAQTNCTPWR
jgi:nitrogen-specific signal transduction histidine kinase